MGPAKQHAQLGDRKTRQTVGIRAGNYVPPEAEKAHSPGSSPARSLLEGDWTASGGWHMRALWPAMAMPAVGVMRRLVRQIDMTL